VRGDPYVKTVYASSSGKGCAIHFKINGKQHSESFAAISDYLDKTYSLKVDPACKDVSRLRFVSDDPDIYINKDAIIFTVPDKQKENKRKTDSRFRTIEKGSGR